MPVTSIESGWSSGSLVFYEVGVGQSATGDVFTIGTTAVTVGNSGQDVDFKIFLGAADQYVLFDSAAALVTFAKVDVAINGDLTLDLEDIQLGDNQYLQFGDATGGDVSARWVSATSLLQILPAADDTGAIHIGDGTTDIDVRVFLGTSGKYVDFAVSESSLVLSAGVQLDVDDTTASTTTATGSIHTAGGLGVAGATYLGTVLGLNSAASDIILIANTAAALEFYDATTKFLVADTRNTVAADMLTMTGIPATIAGASGTTRRMLNIVPGTTTLTGSTGVTDMTGIGLYVTAPTLTDASAITVAEASTVEIAGAPAAGGSVTITKGLALKVTSGKSMFAGNVDFGVDATGVDVTFYGDSASHKVWFDQDGDTDGAWYFGANTFGIQTTWYSDVTGYLVKWEPKNDTNGAWYFGADTKGVAIFAYGVTTGCGMFWDPDLDTNGTLTLGASGGAKGNDFIAYGATNGSSVQWDQSADSLLVTSPGLAATGRAFKVSATQAAGALADGYGMVEFDCSIAGNTAESVAAFSSWLNINSGVALTGYYAAAQTNGIYQVGASTVTNAKLVFGLRMQAIMAENDGLLFPFSVNCSGDVMTAVFDCNTTDEFGLVTNAGTDTGTLIPFLRTTDGNFRYIKMYTLV